MGTRSLTFVNDGKTRLVCFYRQFDGYPSGYGMELAKFLMPITIVNGFNSDMAAGTHANGAGCLAAQLIKHFKKGLDGIYIYAPKGGDCDQEYEYHITVNEGKINIKVKAPKEVIFNGDVHTDEFEKFCKEYE